jgi:hypothetical protein
VSSIEPYRGLTRSETEKTLPQDWRQFLKPVRYLYCLTHSRTGEKITRYGTAWEVRDGVDSALVAEWDLPLCLDDQAIDPTVWVIGSCYELQQ